jgi:hypothetical protein
MGLEPAASGVTDGEQLDLLSTLLRETMRKLPRSVHRAKHRE